ncbi:uncharacterized protein L201_007539 [Kwoniella dendrophila CBS 6074]|uniref:Uncharacterized protein n=1 Tax=Kwoniella dendrophila CBS 6074 TaxID=1295534 RepID=A0AAX4K6X9_9TREE
MKFTLTTITLFGLLAGVKADRFANFFVDENCNEDGSIGFDLDNPGCFTQYNMKSVYIPNNPIDWNQHYCLVMSYGDEGCDCQNDSYSFLATGFCHQLDGKASSYRFIGGKCDPNNCP